ncbi:hypothetical protein [Mariluticola halotolerans]|uniref:hypothetical protein n=1 Tax=Mariluticola halotolerans TaxID=2909283 RepID=UPI0026E142F2|nr:hypothetical protein [Mariluticola halotolerans]UJQ94929.1 hypothetical protein L1P08_02775 [Mariluticola halotolerans]
MRDGPTSRAWFRLPALNRAFDNLPESPTICDSCAMIATQATMAIVSSKLEFCVAVTAFRLNFSGPILVIGLSDECARNLPCHYALREDH